MGQENCCKLWTSEAALSVCSFRDKTVPSFHISWSVSEESSLFSVIFQRGGCWGQELAWLVGTGSPLLVFTSAFPHGDFWRRGMTVKGIQSTCSTCSILGYSSSCRECSILPLRCRDWISLRGRFSGQWNTNTSALSLWHLTKPNCLQWSSVGL